MVYREVSMKKGKTKEGRFPVGRFFAWKTRDVSMGCMTIILGYLSLYAGSLTPKSPESLEKALFFRQIKFCVYGNTVIYVV